MLDEFFSIFVVHTITYVYNFVAPLKVGSRVGWPNNFLNVLQLLSPLKRKLSNFFLRSIFIFNKKESRSCQFATYRRKTQFEFLASQTGRIAFTIFKVIIR